MLPSHRGGQLGYSCFIELKYITNKVVAQICCNVPLKSCDSPMARPARHSTARESPQLATTKVDAVTQQTTWSWDTVPMCQRHSKSLQNDFHDDFTSF